MRSWKACLLDHSITPIQQFAYTSGKNATDGAMIIDAMDLLYTNRFSSFCIVSSDSDFTRLAARIREQGVTVYGFGERKTNNAFIAACDNFMYFDVLGVESDADAEEPSTVPQAPSHNNAASQATPAPPDIPTGPRVPVLVRPQIPKRPLGHAAITGLKIAILNVPSYKDDGWVNLSSVGSYLRKISPDLQARNYGYPNLREFVYASGLVELSWQDMGDKPRVALARLKDRHNTPWRDNTSWNVSLPTKGQGY